MVVFGTDITELLLLFSDSNSDSETATSRPVLLSFSSFYSVTFRKSIETDRFSANTFLTIINIAVQSFCFLLCQTIVRNVKLTFKPTSRQSDNLWTPKVNTRTIKTLLSRFKLTEEK
jgi:hypothetical protein